MQFLHANAIEIAFADYDAFYLFNPFEENIFGGHKIDSSVPLSPELFKRYSSMLRPSWRHDRSGRELSPTWVMRTRFRHVTPVSPRCFAMT